MTIYHFVSESGYEDYALNEAEREELWTVYSLAESPFTVTPIEKEEEENDDYDDHASLTAAQRNPLLR